MARNLNLDNMVSPDEVLTVTLQGSTHKCRKVRVRDALHFEQIDTIDKEAEEWIFALLVSHIEDVDPATLDDLDLDQWAALVRFLIRGKVPKKEDDEGNTDAEIATPSGAPSPQSPESTA